MSSVVVGVKSDTVVVANAPITMVATFTNTGANDFTIDQALLKPPPAGAIALIQDAPTQLGGIVVPAGTSLDVFWTVVVPEAFPTQVIVPLPYAFRVVDTAGTASMLTPALDPSVTILPITAAALNAVVTGQAPGSGSLWFDSNIQSGLLAVI